LASAIAALEASGSSPRLDALALLERVLGRDRAWLIAHDREALSAKQSAEFETLWRRRRSGVPIPYILGTAAFYGREFLVNERVLIPRPETEHLAEEAIGFIRDRGSAARVLDVGTGSGALACSIAAETNAIVDATDAFPAAVAIARENAKRLGVTDRCLFYEGDLADRVTGRRYDVILANLPYIPTADLPSLPDPVGFEPRNALDGGRDGLSLYRKLIPQLPPLLNENGLVLLEAAPPTIDTLKKLLRSALPSFTISLGLDYAGLERYVKAIQAQ
jgi:release factor glutamine methyltransferase